ncbi:MAG: ComEA family DNA-binding protein [Bradymonadaceae bacterium]
MARVYSVCLAFLIVSFFIVGCAEPMPLHATYLPVDWSCDHEPQEPDDLMERLEATSPNIGDDWYDGLLEPGDEEMPPVSLNALYGPTYASTMYVPTASALTAFPQASGGLSFVVDRGDAPAAEKAPRKKRPAAGPPSGVININEASAQELTLLPGIGPSLAERIVAYRGTRKFGQPQHLRRVKGIGAAKYRQIQEHVVVEGETTLRR